MDKAIKIKRSIVNSAMTVMKTIIIMDVVCHNLILQIMDQTGQIPSVRMRMSDIDEYRIFFFFTEFRELRLIEHHISAVDHPRIFYNDRNIMLRKHILQLTVIFAGVLYHCPLFFSGNPAVVVMKHNIFTV